MGLIVLEAALALAVLIFLIWWTMFSGRRDGELRDEPPPDPVNQAEGGPAQGLAQPAERGGTRKDMG